MTADELLLLLDEDRISAKAEFQRRQPGYVGRILPTARLDSVPELRRPDRQPWDPSLDELIVAGWVTTNAWGNEDPGIVFITEAGQARARHLRMQDVSEKGVRGTNRVE